MANVSDTSVRIQAKGCAKEVREWLKAIDKEAYYNICDDHEGTTREDLGGNSADFCGVANGRWTYQTNAEGAFGTAEEREHWCSEQGVEATYNAILLALKDNPEAYVQVDYTEAETGMNFIGQGSVYMYYDTDIKEVETSMDYGVLGDASIDNLIAYGFADSVEDAKEYLGIEEEEQKV